MHINMGIPSKKFRENELRWEWYTWLNNSVNKIQSSYSGLHSLHTAYGPRLSHLFILIFHYSPPQLFWPIHNWPFCSDWASVYTCQGLSQCLKCSSFKSTHDLHLTFIKVSAHNHFFGSSFSSLPSLKWHPFMGSTPLSFFMTFI